MKSTQTLTGLGLNRGSGMVQCVAKFSQVPASQFPHLVIPICLQGTCLTIDGKCEHKARFSEKAGGYYPYCH